MMFKVHKRQITCFRKISERHLNKILDLICLGEKVRHNYMREFIKEAFGEDIGIMPVSYLHCDLDFRLKLKMKKSSQSSQKNRPSS
jgi:hypothetical protein